jgi:Cu+-exporting ATPase
MDTLVALGSTTAFAYSAWVMISGRGGHVFFMESAAIITLISVGHWLESRVSVRASSALRDLLHLAPQKARKLNFNHSSPLQAGSEIEVPVSALRTNDVIALRPGERVPTDGEVIEGSSAIDESMLTGESIPKDKTAGNRVYTGTVNLNGRLLVRVQETGDATALAHIIQAVERAQTSRAQIQRLGDRVSSVFVPVVVVIAILSGLWWGLAPEPARHLSHWLQQYLWHSHPPAGTLAAAVLSTAAVLIVACPCAMGLATPAAIMAGANAAARRGILIRDGVALEKAGKITGVIFDKTGTLTVGKPSVAEIWTNPVSLSHPTGEGRGEGSVLELAAALARHSTHPVSLALANIAPVTAQIRNWQELRGAGLQAETKTAGSEWINARLGSLNWMKEWGVNCDAGGPFISKWTAQGATVVGLAADGVLVGLFALRDSIKPSAPAVVRQLQDAGFETFLVTGDTVLTAETIGRELGIPAQNIFAEVRPEKKAEFVKKLQAQGKRVAFVGDGINDAPALEQSDLGIAVTRASDIAREAADIVLLNSELEAVPESLGLARATLRTIKQNLFWAFFYNAVGVPLAALGFMSPILCAGAMAFSDILVIGNALRLLRWKSPLPRNR